MLFRSINGELIELKRFNYISDKEYFKLLIMLKNNKLKNNNYLKNNEDSINKIYKLI